MNALVAKSLVIVGNGYLPYLTGLFLQKNIKQTNANIIIVDLDGAVSSEGELIQSLSAMRYFHRDLGISESHFVASTQAEINLGFDYCGFSPENAMVCDAPYGFNLQNRRFYYLYRKYREAQAGACYEQFCLSAQLARRERFSPPSPKQTSVYSTINYGYRLTSGSYKKYLLSLAANQGIKVFSQALANAELNEQGYVQSVKLNDGTQLPTDLVIDCGESRIVKNHISSQLGGDDIEYLPVSIDKKAVAEKDLQSRPYGKISNSNRKLSIEGSYLNRRYISTYSQMEKGESPIWFDKQPWQKNCITLGAASSNRPSLFIDNTLLQQNALLRLLQLWPRTSTMVQESRCYNRKALQEMEQISSLDLLHWAFAFEDKTLLPEDMVYKLELFKGNGKVVYYENEILQNDQWPVLFYALGVVPSNVDISVSEFTLDWLSQELEKIKTTFYKAAAAAPTYSQFIQSVHR